MIATALFSLMLRLPDDPALSKSEQMTALSRAWERSLNTVLAGRKSVYIVDIPLPRAPFDPVRSSLSDDVLEVALGKILKREVSKFGTVEVYKRDVSGPKPFGAEPQNSIFAWLSVCSDAELSQLDSSGIDIENASPELQAAAFSIASLNRGLSTDILAGRPAKLKAQFEPGFSYKDAAGHVRSHSICEAKSYSDVDRNAVSKGAPRPESGVPLRKGEVHSVMEIAEFLVSKGFWVNYDGRLKDSLIYISEPLSVEVARIAFREIATAKPSRLFDTPKYFARDALEAKLRSGWKGKSGEGPDFKPGVDSKLGTLLKAFPDKAGPFRNMDKNLDVRTQIRFSIGIGNSGSSLVGGFLPDGTPNRTLESHSVNFMITP
jgi:hypothetical protein